LGETSWKVVRSLLMAEYSISALTGFFVSLRNASISSGGTFFGLALVRAPWDGACAESEKEKQLMIDTPEQLYSL